MIRALQQTASYWIVYYSDTEVDEWSVWTMLGSVRRFQPAKYRACNIRGERIAADFPDMLSAMRALSK